MNANSEFEPYWREESALWYLMSPNKNKPMGVFSSVSYRIWGKSLHPDDVVCRLPDHLILDDAKAMAKVIIMANQ